MNMAAVLTIRINKFKKYASTKSMYAKLIKLGMKQSEILDVINAVRKNGTAVIKKSVSEDHEIKYIETLDMFFDIEFYKLSKEYTLQDQLNLFL